MEAKNENKRENEFEIKPLANEPNNKLDIK